VNASSPQIVVFVVTAAVILLVIGLRMRRMMRSTPFDPNRALLYPVIIAAIGVYVVSMASPRGLEWLWLAAALVVGGGLGWLRASTVKMSVDPQTGQLMAQGSFVAILFLVVLLVVRTGLRLLLVSQSAALGIRLVMADVIFLALAVGLLGARALEMNLRGRKLLAIHRAQPQVLTSDQAHV
jgi:NAD/NADP transhydrogenase beta subunit